MEYNMLQKMWNIEREKIETQSVFWNIMSSGINSIVSMLLLWVVTFVNGVADAGLFSLGFSTSQMMLTVANYGMRNYQATDINHKYSMRVYLASRIITSIVMIVSAFAFVRIEGYFFEKALITVLLCLLKVTDAVDDVYGGYYQQQGRLDISGKIMSVRIVAYIIAFCVSLLFSHNLMVSICIAIFISTFILIVLVKSTQEVVILEKPEFNWKKIFLLLYECAPLCVCAFLLIYIGNAPKYAIDTYMSSSEQALYTYLFMPCFVTNLFVGFALQPLLVRLSKKWLHKEYEKFLKLCGLIFLGAIGISGIILGLGSAFGCQILSIVFGVQLIQYKKVLVILLVGGAFYAFAIIEQVILTVMRKQLFFLIGFVIASVVAFFISNPLVKSFGLLGAGYAYLISTGVLFLTLAVLIFVFIFCEKKEGGSVD